MKKIALPSLLLFISLNSFSQWVRVDGLDNLSVFSVCVNQVYGDIYVATRQNGTYKGIFHKPNLSAPWSKIYKGADGVVVNKLEMDPEGKLYAGTTNGVYYLNSIDSLISINDGLPDYGSFPAVSCISSIDDYLYIGTNAGIFRTGKDNINWHAFNQNISLGTSANRILKYHNDIVASFPDNIYRTGTGSPNWQSAASLSSGQTASPPTINDMAVGDSAIYLAVQGAWSCAFRSIGDSMIFRPCAKTNDLTAYCIFGYNSDFWVGTFYGGAYKGTNNGNNLVHPSPNLPAWATPLSMAKYGTALMVGDEYYSYNIGSGGLYYFDNSLPVAIKDELFKASVQSGIIKVSWQNFDALNSSYYELQRKADKENSFRVIATIPAKKDQYDYSYADNNISNANKTFQYRLKIINKDGSSRFSRAIAINIPGRHADFLVSPNPASKMVDIRLDNTSGIAPATVTIHNSTGNSVLKKMFPANENIKIDVTGLPRGIYLVTVESGNEVFTKKLILQ